MKKLLASLALASLAGGVALLASRPREGCGARCCRRPTPESDCMRRNPHTGEMVSVPAKKRVKWLTAVPLKKSLNA